MIYLTLKLLHIVGAVLFLGNITTGVFWKLHADKSRDPKVIVHALEGVVRSDQVFTIPGVMMILVGGFGAALIGHLPLIRTAWLFGGILLFTITGIVFMTRVAPLQRQMLLLARAGQSGGNFDWTGYEKLSRQWAFWGTVALIAPALAAGLMVLKPTW